MRTNQTLTGLTALMLSITVALKLGTAAGNAAILSETDPIIGTDYRTVLLLVSAIEAAVVGILLFAGSNLIRAYSIAALFGSFLAYRAAVFVAGEGAKPCPCLGSLYQWLRVDPAFTNGLSVVFLFFGLFVGYYLVLIETRHA